MNFENRPGQHGTDGVSRQKGRPCAQPNTDRCVRLKFQVGDGVMAPIKNFAGGGNSLERKFVGRGCKRNVALAVAFICPEAEFVAEFRILIFARSFFDLDWIAEHPSLTCDAQTQQGLIVRATAGNDGIENRIVAQHAAGLEVKTTGVHAAQGHAISDGILQTVNDAADRLRETSGRKLQPFRARLIGGEESGGGGDFLAAGQPGHGKADAPCRRTFYEFTAFHIREIGWSFCLKGIILCVSDKQSNPLFVMFKDIHVGRRPADWPLKSRPPGCVQGRPASGVPAAVLMEIKGIIVVFVWRGACYIANQRGEDVDRVFH